MVIKIILGLVIEKLGDLVVFLNDFKLGDVLFIDEIYCLFKVVEEMFYLVMEDFYIDIVVGEGFMVYLVYFLLLFFILIGVIIWVGLLVVFLWDWFGIVVWMDYYIIMEFS